MGIGTIVPVVHGGWVIVPPDWHDNSVRFVQIIIAVCLLCNNLDACMIYVHTGKAT